MYRQYYPMASLLFKSFQANPQKNALAQGLFFICVWALIVGGYPPLADAQENTMQDQSRESIVYFPMETADQATVVYGLVGSEMCIRDRSTFAQMMDFVQFVLLKEAFRGSIPDL